MLPPDEVSDAGGDRGRDGARPVVMPEAISHRDADMSKMI